MRFDGELRYCFWKPPAGGKGRPDGESLPTVTVKREYEKVTVDVNGDRLGREPGKDG
jgi:hypothetical protein